MRFLSGVGFLFLLLATLPALAAEPLQLSPFNTSGIYRIGERVGWNISRPNTSTTAPSPQKFSFVIRKNNLDTLKSGEIDLTTGSTTIDTTCDEPAMLYLEINTAGKPVVAGAAVAPTELKPVAPRPADFDSFWQSKIVALEQIPPNPVLTPHDSGDPSIDYATIQMNHVNGTHVYGQLAKPKRGGKLPAIVMFQWASPPYPLQKAWILGYAKQGFLVLDIEPHNVLPDQPKPYYDALPPEIRHYESTGNDDRDNSFFVEMYLRDYRAVDYIAGRPDWDGKTLVVTGTSMGGQQSLCVAGLHPKITHLIVNEPAGCDTNAGLHGRQEGYPNFPSNNVKVMETALYVDPINFAPHIKAKSLVAMGFVDTTAPPAGIWTAFNEIQGPKEAVPMIDSPHNHLATAKQQQPFNQRSAEWFATLARGGEVLRSANTPSPRTEPKGSSRIGN